MKKTLAILFVLLSLLSFVALTYDKFGIMQLSMFVVFIALTALILALRNRNIDALMIVFFSLALIDSLIMLTKSGLSMEVIFYTLVNMVGLFVPLTGTDIVKVKRIVKRVEKPEVKVEKKKEEMNFVASKTGKVYHKASCKWVDNIEEGKRVWFKTPAQARKAGYKVHKCK